MGCDGFLKDLDWEPRVYLRCHQCGRLLTGPPLKTHAECVLPDGRLPVNIDLPDDYEER